MKPRPLRPIRLGAGLLAGLLLVSGAGCTGGSRPEGGPSSSSSGPSGSVAASRPAPPSAPLRVQVTHVAGRLTPARRRALVAGVTRALSSYVDGAFPAGGYPRSSFGAAFATFTPGAARRARGDAALLTDQPLGPTTRSVRATRRTAYLAVLAPRQRVAGVTAAVDLVLLVDRGDDPAQRVRLRGRLLLTRAAGRWRIFGYDLRRTQAPARIPAPGASR